MTCRGVKKAGSLTYTYSTLGELGQDKKNEVLSLIKR